MRIVALLLAAGRSTRFGEADKLRAPLGGIPLGLHAARTIAALPLATRIVVSPHGELAWPGFHAVPNGDPEAGMARSLALGIGAARDWAADAVLIALADMPFVPRAQFERLMAGGAAGAVLTSSDGRSRMPPALFGAQWFDRLESLNGDTGARSLLEQAVPIETHPDHLIDIDTPADLARAEIIAGGAWPLSHDGAPQ
jgi:molybdenum cofactor cytidylyltransferase